MRFGIFVLAVFALAAGLFCSDVFLFAKEYNGSGGRGDLQFSFSTPNAIAIGSGGIIYVGDSGLGGVYGIDSNDKVVKVIGKSGGASDFGIISDVKYYEGSVYVADRGGSKIYKNVDGSGLEEVGPSRAILLGPEAIWLEQKTLWVLNTQADKIIEFDMERNYLKSEYLGPGIGVLKIKGAKDFAFDKEHIYVADTLNYRIEIYNRSFGYVGSVGTGKGGVTIEKPGAVAVDSQGRIYASDWVNGRIVVFDIHGNVLETFGKQGSGVGEFKSPAKMAFSENGTLYIVDTGNKRIVAYELNWTANDQSAISEVEAAENIVKEYKQNVIDVMEKAGASYQAYSSLADIEKAYEYIEEERYADAKASAKKALDRIEQRRKADEQALDNRLSEIISSHKFGLNFYSAKQLTLEEEKKRIDLQTLLDEAKTDLEGKRYASGLNSLLEIGKWLDIIEKKYAQQTQEKNETVQEKESEISRQVLIKNRAANMQVGSDELRKRADEAQIYGGFETVNTLIETSLELAKAGAYEEAEKSLENARIKLGEIEARVSIKEKGISVARVEIEKAQKELLALGVSINDSSSAAAAELAGAMDILVQEPDKASIMAKRAVEYAQKENSLRNEVGYALAAVAGAFVAIISIGAIAAFYIIRRAKSRRGSPADVSVKFTKTLEEKRIEKKEKKG